MNNNQHDKNPPATDQDGVPHLWLSLPDDWQPAPVDPTEVGRWVAEAFDVEGVDSATLHHLEVGFRSMAVEARAEGLVLAAGFVDVIHPEDAPAAQVVGASTFAMVRPAEKLEGVLSSFAWTAALVTAEEEGGLELLRPPETIVLGEHEMVKAVSLDRFPEDSGAPEFVQLAVDYYTSLNDGAAMLILGFRTPCLWLADDFEQLFDEIAATAELSDSHRVQ